MMIRVKTLLLQIIFILMLSFLAGITFNAIRRNSISLFSYNKPDDKAICDATEESCVVELTLQEVEKKYLDGTAIFIDARDEVEYISGHIKGALSLPFNRFDTVFYDVASTIPLAKEIIVYCNGSTCELAKKLGEKLVENGYTKVRVLKEGFPMWKTKGLPIDYSMP